jgi:hypothetical protein
MDSDVVLEALDDINDLIFILSIMSVIQKYTNRKSIDSVIYKKKRYLRGQFANMTNYESEFLISNPKTIKLNTIPQIRDPFGSVSRLTECQEHVKQFDIRSFGAVAYKCACGSGKTLAGLYLMYKLRCKTLIISARCAVNYQWEKNIHELFPELMEGTDYWIFTPHYLIRHLDIPIKPEFIIFDEVHSLLSPVFKKTIELAFNMVLDGRLKELPFMLSLSATYPVEHNMIISKIFGNPITINSKITDIPVYYTSLKIRDEIYALNIFLQKAREQYERYPNRKGIIITNRIDSSVYGGLLYGQKLNVNVLILRQQDEYSLFVPKGLDYDFDHNITLNKLISNNIGTLVRNPFTVMKDVSIISGTIERVKEGLSVQDLVWGICTKFPWVINSRIQILGRIRRSSDDPELNNTKRVMFTSSWNPPRKFTMGKVRGINYNFDKEIDMFKTENYIKFEHDQELNFEYEDDEEEQEA